MSLVAVIFPPITKSWPIVTDPTATLLGEIWSLSLIIGNVCCFIFPDLSIYFADSPQILPIIVTF